MICKGPFVIDLLVRKWKEKSGCITAHWLSSGSGGRYQTDFALLQAVRGLTVNNTCLSEQTGNCVLHTHYFIQGL